MSQAISASLSSLDAASTAAGMVAGNLANTDTDGFKSFQVAYSSIADTLGVMSQGVIANTVITVDQTGPTRTTGVASDIFINGNGLIPVTNSQVTGQTISASDSVLFSRNGSFRKNKDGNFVDNSGNLLLAWALDANLNLPPNKSITQSLSPVNIQQLVSSASATTSVGMSVNLNSETPAAGNGHGNMYMVNSGLKPSPYNAFSASSDILQPNINTSLTVGEGISIKTYNLSQGTPTTTNLIYGGFVQTLTFANTGTNLVAGTGTNLATDNFTISVQGNNMPVNVRGNGANNLAVLQNITNQINSTTGGYALTARIINDGNNSSILIAPLDATLSMNFPGSTSFGNSIGLTISQNTVATQNRFASMQNLANILNNIAGVSASASNAGNASILLSSTNPLYISNYNPLGMGSDFMTEFNINQGFLPSSYNAYDSNNNMAGSTTNSIIKANYLKDFSVYDSMGNEYTFILSFLKVNANQWAVEMYSLDATAVNVPGRVDGLLQAGVINFDGNGLLQSLEPTVQQATSVNVGAADIALGATNGQVLNIQVGTTNYAFNYNNGIIAGSSVSGIGTNLASGTGTDVLSIACGGSTFTFARNQIATSGTNQAFLNSLATLINQTVGPNAVRAQVVNDSAGNFHIAINAVNVTNAISFLPTSQLTTDLGLNGQALNTDNQRFSTLYDLERRINETSGLYSIQASIIPGTVTGSYRIAIQTLNAETYMTFSGTPAAVINSPLGNGITTTLDVALGLHNTNAQSQITNFANDVNINWSPAIGANPSNIQVTFGAIGDTQGTTQNSAQSDVKSEKVNGISPGQLTTIAIDSQGYIIANFNNAQTRKIYKIPVATFANPNGLMPVSGNVFSAGKDSGPLNLNEAGNSGAGTIVSGSIESSNVDISQELANLMEIQRRFQASSKVINVDDKMTQVLLNSTYA